MSESSNMSRRAFVGGGAGIAAGIALAGPFSGYVAHAARGVKGAYISGYGPIGPVPDQRDGVVRLDLPQGFSYRSFHTTGTVLGDGVTLPGRHDGMAAFAGRKNNSIIVRNHEVNGPGTALGGAGAVYDPMTMGGTVTFEVDPFGKVVRDWVSLRGSQMNCAGGASPWGTWLTCEETVNGDDVGPDFTGAPNTGLKKHGYIFEVPTTGTSNAVPIKATGRFAHEAIVVAPNGMTAYLTEDNFNFASGFYRYLLPKSGFAGRKLHDGGVLQMLKVVGVDNADLSLHQPPGTSYAVEWVTVDDPDPTMPPATTNDQAITMVSNQGWAKGAAYFSRLEGCFMSGKYVYFTSTQGGATVDVAPAGFGDGRGQVWRYDTLAKRLQLVYESPATSTLDLPDNLVVSRKGTLVLCEDGSGDNFLRGLTPSGQIFNFARNADATQVGQEFAGATFSHTAKTLFVNIQSGSGYSIAIWGPFQRGPF